MTIRRKNSSSIRYGEELIEYEIHHRPAVTRRIHLELDEGGSLKVVAPRRMSRRAIRNTLQQRACHVARFLIEARSRQQELPALHYVSDEEHLFLGRRFPLSVVVLPGKRGGAERVDGRIRIVVSDPDPDRIRNRLLGWYRQQAQHLFGERLAVISQETPWTGGEPPPMRLRKMKRTWGSCSAKGVITLNPQLVKAPPECIDYVIAHEICHLREHNHSKAFYALQDQLNPSWRKTRDQLREKEHLFLHT